MELSRIGIDLAKNVFQLHGVDRDGKAVFKRRLKREEWLRVLLGRTKTDCVIGMEACGGAHHWARELQSKGYTVRLIAPQFVKPYVKSIEQQDIQAVHRIRAECMTHRTAKANQIRGLVTEYGLVAPKHMTSLRGAIPRWLEDAENGLTSRFRRLLHGLWEDLRQLEERVAALDGEVKLIAKSDPVARRLQQLRGVGPLVATALVASVGTGEQFSKGRQMAASIGLTPRQHSSGGKDRLLGISKRGDVYLRSILIHGARSVVSHAKHKEDRLSRWVTEISRRRHPNVAAVALANKTVRMAWAMMRNGSDYDPEFVVA